ncbi:MAG: PEGA domain-containing protein, partial [Elusimicrobiota bacterium]
MNKQKINLLVVEDDTALLDAIKMILESEGYNVKAVDNGSEAVEYAQKEDVDIIISDYYLPDINGLEVIKQILQINKNPIPILISGERSMEVALKGMRLGVHDYLVKPLDYDELRKIIKDILVEREQLRRGRKRLREDLGEEYQEESEKERTEEKKRAYLYDSDREFEEFTGEKSPAITGKEIETKKESDKTVFDFIPEKALMLKKKFKGILITLILIALIFSAVDTFFLQMTNIGKTVYSKIYPPSFILDSSPSGAEVVLKNKEGKSVIEKGEKIAPVRIPEIAPGVYDLKMDLKGYKPISRKITIGMDMEKKKIQEILVPGINEKISEKGKVKRIVIPFDVSAIIDSEPPGAVIYIDGKKMGTNTPLKIDLTAEKHNIRMEKEGYPDLGSTKSSNEYGYCNLDFSQREQKNVDQRVWNIKYLDQGVYLKGFFFKEVSINSNPQGAKYFINGSMVGRTPSKAKLKVGKHDILVKKDGFAEWNNTIVVPGQNRINASLRNNVKFIAYDKNNPGKDIGAEVWINRKKIEGKKTPFYYSFEPDTYRVAFLKRPRYNQWTKHIEITEQDEIVAHMEPKEYGVEIYAVSKETGKPVDNAEVIIDGNKMGLTNENGIWASEIYPGHRTIKITKGDNFEAKTVSKEIAKGTGLVEI